MVDQQREPVERRVILSSALASLAVGTAACSGGAAQAGVDAVTAVNDFRTAEPGGFGSEAIDVASLADFHSEVEANNGFLYRPAARAWLVSYPEEFIAQAKEVYPEEMHEGLDVGVVALFQKCPHLGCRVPECGASQQFECPCHGSMYTHYGEHLVGPAPHGMYMFPTRIVDGRVMVDTSTVIEGLPHGTNVTDWVLSDESCLGSATTES